MIALSQPEALPRTFAEFERFEPTDGYKYEWNDGELIRTEKMKKKHLYLVRQLNLLFDTTKAKRERGQLLCEQDVMLTGVQMRRPDLAYFSGEQIDRSLTSDDEPIPPFVIEVISPTDESEKVQAKRGEYFRAGVQVVWHIFPEIREVHVCTSPKLIQVCTDEDVCSAAPVLPDFSLTVNALFAQ